MTYLDCVESDIIHVVDNTQQTMRETNKGSHQQKEEVILIQTRLSRTVPEKNVLQQLDNGYRANIISCCYISATYPSLWEQE